MPDGAKRPLPVVDCDSAPFWSALAAHRFQLQRCEDCTQWVFYPRAVCPYCHGERLRWEPASGRGRIYSWTVTRRSPGPYYSDKVPIVVVLVDLDEGPRMLSSLLHAAIEDVRIGSAVELRYVDADGMTLPYFTLVGGPL